MFYTTDEIIASLKTRILAPTGQPTFSTSDFVRFINEEFQLKMVPDTITLREDFFLKSVRLPVAAGLTKYTMPERAIGNVLKDIFYLDSGNNRYPTQRININQIPTNNLSSIYPAQFYIEADQVVIAPTPQAAGGTVQLWYYQRPNELVLESACGQITAVDYDTPTTGQVTYTVNADISSYEVVDFQSGYSPFQLTNIDVPVVSATNSTIVVDMEDVAGQVTGTYLPQVGDWICNEQTAPIPMVPQEFHPLLAEMSAARVVQALGHNEKLEAILGNIETIRKNLFNTLQIRVEQNKEAIFNPYGLVQSTGYGWNLGWPR